MVKYMIQDIVPPGRKHTIHKGEKSDDAQIKKTVSPVGNKAQQNASGPIKTTVSHALHHEHQQEDEPVREIHDEVLSRPQSMIIENLYHEHDAEASAKATIELPKVNVDGGVYPYNKVASEYRTQETKQGWKFPETSNWMSKFGGWIPWIIVPSILIGGGVLLLNHFAGATIQLIPKHETRPIALGESFVATKSPGEGELGFSVMKVTLEDTREVNATGTKTVTAKAKGKIIVYNEQLVPQRLIKNTRFESTKGLIYRINDSVNVPKATVKNGKTSPGTIEVTIYADEAGPNYNSAPSDFTIPGLKNTPQAKKVYGRSNGPVAGGASGTVKSVSDQELKQAGEELRVSLETKLRSKARSDLSPAQIAYDQGIIVQLEEPKLSGQPTNSGDTAVVTESGTLYMVIFDREQLTKAVTAKLIPTYKGENVEMKNLDSLSMTLPKLEGGALTELEKLNFSLSGTPTLIWQVDELKIKKELVGVQKSNFNLILSQYSNIERAKASIQPIWKSSFPSDEKTITVKLVDEIAN